MWMLRKNKKEPVLHQWAEYQNQFKNLKKPSEAVALLQEILDVFGNVDKQALEQIILFLKQISQDIQFKYYKARCKYIIIPPEDSLAFWVSHVLGSLPETSRFSNFESEVQELLKILSEVSEEADGGNTNLISSNYKKDVEIVMSLFKEKYPIFFTGMTRDPVFIPIMNFCLRTGSVLSVPRLHCFGLFKPKSETEHPIVVILHSLAHILHYQITEELDILPPGFENLYYRLFDYLVMTDTDWAETFAEIVVASMLYETPYMPLVAYMELNQEDQNEIRHYLCWLEAIYSSSLQDNIKKLILEYEGRLRA